MNDLETLRAAIGAAREHLDCGDRSCRFALTKRGMRTNGGCRCIDRGSAAPMVAPSLAAVWKAAVAVAERMTWKPLDTLPLTGLASEQPVLVVAPHGGFQGGPRYHVSAGSYVRLDTGQDREMLPTMWMPIPEVQEQKSEDQ